MVRGPVWSARVRWGQANTTEGSQAVAPVFAYAGEVSENLVTVDGF